MTFLDENGETVLEAEGNGLSENNPTHCCSRHLTVTGKNGCSETRLASGASTIEISKNDTLAPLGVQKKIHTAIPVFITTCFYLGTEAVGQLCEGAAHAPV